MIGSGTFRFHKFSEEEKKPYRYNTNTNFYNSNTFDNFQKKRTFQSRLRNKDLYNNNINNINNNINLQSYQFQTNRSPILPKLPKIKENNNLLYSDSNIAGLQKYPFKIIINMDFENIIKNGELAKIDTLLPQMLFNNLSFTNNNHLQLLLQKYQTLLRFLFAQQEQLININNQREELFNNEDSDLNKKIKKIEQDEYRTKNLLTINQLQIGKLRDKIRAYKNIIISSGNEKYLPNKTLSNRRGRDGLYHCQICPDIKFNTYEQIHAHYIMEHFHLYNNKNILYNTNNINKMYFDNKLNIFKNELKNELININKQYDDNYNDKKYDDLRNEMNLKDFNKNSNKFSEKNKSRNNMSSNNLPSFKNLTLNNNNEINSYLNRLEFEQKCQYDNLTENFNKLKEEIFNEIKNLVIYQPAPNTQDNKIKETTKIETNIIKNTTIINEKNNNDVNINDSNDNLLNKINSNHIDNENINKNVNDNNDIMLGTNKEINEDEKKYDSNIEKKDENVNKIPDNKSKLLSDKYTKNIQPIKEESVKNDSTLNNIYNDNSKFTNQENTPAGDIQKKSVVGESFNENPYLKDINKSKSKFGESINMNINNNFNYNIINSNLTKSQFQELYDKREETTLFNKNNDIKHVGYDYKIMDINKKYTQSVLKLKDDNLNNMIKQYENKYLDHDNEATLSKEGYENVILAIMKDNIKKGNNNELFMKYYNNVLEKNDLNTILKKIEDEKKKKEMEMEEALNSKKNKEEEIDTMAIDFNDILRTKTNKKSRKKSQVDFGEPDESDNILNKIKKGGGDDEM